MAKHKSLKYLIARIFGHPLFNSTRTDRLPILCYHSINDAPNSECDPLPSKSFEAHLEFLNQNYTITPLRTVAEKLAAGDALPSNCVAITFDDGYRDNFEIAYPLLKKHNAHATIFIVSGFIDGEVDLIGDDGWEAMNWDQVRQLDASDVVEIGAHTHTHRILSSLDDRAAIEEIRLSKWNIEKQLGRNIDLFAYPNGQGADISSAAVNAVQNLGFVGAVSTFWRSTHRPSQRYLINRIMTDGKDDVETLKLKLSGGYDYIYYIHKLKAIISSVKSKRSVWK